MQMDLPTDLTVVAGAGKLCLPRHTVVLGAAGVHRACSIAPGFPRSGTGCIFRHYWRCHCLAATMALLSAGFSMRPARRGGVAKMIGSGVAAGFSLFVVSKIAEEIGQSGALPVAFWPPGRQPRPA